MRYSICLLAITFCVGCDGGKSPSASADFQVDLLTFANELADSKVDAIAKYRDKTIRFAGTVHHKVEPHGLNDSMGIAFEELPEDLAFESMLSLIFMKDASSFNEISVGDQITVACRFEVPIREVLLLKFCDLVE